jgi:hypothetical protein
VRQPAFEVNFVRSFVRGDAISHGSDANDRTGRTLCGRALTRAEIIRPVDPFVGFEPCCLTCRKRLAK